MALQVNRWTRYGNDRLYVEADGLRIGHRDLKTGIDHPATPGDASLLKAACDAWQSGSHLEPRQAPEPEAMPAQAEPEEHWIDLADNVPGQAARQQAAAAWEERKQPKPVRALLGRLLDVHTDERAWRIGADGEERVAGQLAKVAKKDPRWRFLHAVPVGTKGSDIDHVAIGPGGVFTVNAKHHPDAKIWVGGDTFMVNGQRQPYIRNSRHEASRASRLLSAAAGFDIAVTGVVVTVWAKDVTIKKAPDDVAVLERFLLARWLRRRPDILSEHEVAVVYEAARRSTTWRP